MKIKVKAVVPCAPRPMKESGVEWIGMIPDAWSVSKNKYLLEEMYSGGSPSASNEEFYSEDGIPFVSIGDMSSIRYITGTKKKLTEKGRADKNLSVLPKGTILYSIYATIGAVSELSIEATISQAILALRLKPTYDKQFYKYNLLAMRDYVFVNANGNTQFNLNAEKVWNFTFVVPPIDEQKQIGNYLDFKCAHIDSIIEKTRASIEEYKALKQSIITEVVTKGIRPNRKMKNSGISWISECPEEWSVGKAKYYIVIGNGSDPKSEGDIPVYGSGSTSFKTCGEYKEGPCVLIGRKGATLHIPHYIDHNYWNVDTAFDVKAQSNYCLKYYYYVACCFDYRLYKSQTTLPSMTQTSYENMFIPVPDLEEQQEIAAYLDKQCSKVDELLDKHSMLIDLLEKQKKSIVFEFVTGKKEVPSC